MILPTRNFLQRIDRVTTRNKSCRKKDCATRHFIRQRVEGRSSGVRGVGSIAKVPAVRPGISSLAFAFAFSARFMLPASVILRKCVRDFTPFSLLRRWATLHGVRPRYSWRALGRALGNPPRRTIGCARRSAAKVTTIHFTPPL